MFPLCVTRNDGLHDRHRLGANLGMHGGEQEIKTQVDDATKEISFLLKS